MRLADIYKEFEDSYLTKESTKNAKDTLRERIRKFLIGYGAIEKNPKPDMEISSKDFSRLYDDMKAYQEAKMAKAVPAKKDEEKPASKPAAKPAAKSAAKPAAKAKPKAAAEDSSEKSRSSQPITAKSKKQEKAAKEQEAQPAETPAEEEPAPQEEDDGSIFKSKVVVKKVVITRVAVKKVEPPAPKAAEQEEPAEESALEEEAPAAAKAAPEAVKPAEEAASKQEPPQPEEPKPAKAEAQPKPAPAEVKPEPALESKASEQAPAAKIQEPEKPKAIEPEKKAKPEQKAEIKKPAESPKPVPKPVQAKPVVDVKPVSTLTVDDYKAQQKENLPRVTEIVPLANLKGWQPHDIKKKPQGRNDGRNSGASQSSQPAIQDPTGIRKPDTRKGKKDNKFGIQNREEMLNRPRISSQASLRQRNADERANEEGEYRIRRSKAKRQAGNAAPTKAEIVKGDIKVSVPINVRDFSQEIGVKVGDIIKVFFKMGEMLTINSSLDEDHVVLVAAELGVNVSVKSKEENLEATTFSEEGFEEEMTAEEAPRAPVVVFMGHVDHGKTSLIDAIREAKVAAGESGGITQHIGAYEVDTSQGHITIIDTPGHEAFTTMRARGANSTDIAVLVVAADDGVMPQTLEAINHARAAKVEVIVAINKMDLPGANPEKVIRQLSENNILVEDWGGEVQCIKVSAHTKEGLDKLLEAIALQAEVMQLKARAEGPAEGVVLEAELNPGRGVCVTLLVQKGRLKLGDPIVCGTSYAKARAIMDYRGREIKEAGPSQPVLILGFNEVPQPGAKFRVAASEKLAKELTEQRAEDERQKRHDEAARATLENFYKNMNSSDESKELALIVKGDTRGTTEAVKAALERLTTKDAKVTVLHSGVGDVTENDVMLASASNGVIIAFKTSVMEGSKALAKSKSVEIRQYDVIYHATEQIEKALKGLLEPTFHEEEQGVAEIRMLFKLPNGVVAGSYVTNGEIHRSDKARIYRGKDVIYEGEIQTLRHLKDDVKEVRSGYECGIVFKDFNDLKEGDKVHAFKMVQDGLAD